MDLFEQCSTLKGQKDYNGDIQKILWGKQKFRGVNKFRGGGWSNDQPLLPPKLSFFKSSF